MPWVQSTCSALAVHMQCTCLQVKWYELDDKERRGYKLMPEVRHIVVNAMIRLGGLHFEGSQGGPQARSFRSKGKGLSFLGLDAKNLILAACD